MADEKLPQPKYVYKLNTSQTKQMLESPRTIYVTSPITNDYVSHSDFVASEITKNSHFFEHVQQFFKDKSERKFVIKTNTPIGKSVSLSKFEIVSILESLAMRDSATKQQISVYKSLKELVSQNVLLQDYKGKTHTVNIDGVDITFDCQDLITTLISPQEVLLQKIEQLETTGMASIYFYALTHFAKSQNLFEKYFFDRPTVNNYQDIQNSRYVDIQAINTLLETDNTYLNKTFISPELRQQIFKDMPEDLSQLEQAQYIYLKMCKLFTYDQAYFASGQSGPLASKHKDISYIANLTPQNNEAVCYEFSAIYSKLLTELNINNELVFVNKNNSLGDLYGHKHSYVRFRTNEFLVNADPFMELRRSDLTRVKLGMPTRNLHCKNLNKYTQQSFNNTLQRVYSLVNKDSEQNSSFEEALLQYQSFVEPTQLTFKEKFDFILQQLSNTNLPAMDVLSYVHFLYNKVLSGNQQESFVVSAIRHTPNDNFGNLDKNIAELGIIISVGNSALTPEIEQTNEDDTSLFATDFISDPKGYTRAYYSSSTGLQPLTTSQMFNYFNSGKFSYVHPLDTPVVGGPLSEPEFVLNGQDQ